MSGQGLAPADQFGLSSLASLSRAIEVAYWDEYMRRPDVRKGRQCIRPGVSCRFHIKMCHVMPPKARPSMFQEDHSSSAQSDRGLGAFEARHVLITGLR